MKSPIVIIGIGELGSIFARGFLRLGHPVYPVTRATSLAAAAAALPEPELGPGRGRGGRPIAAVGDPSQHLARPFRAAPE